MTTREVTDDMRAARAILNEDRRFQAACAAMQGLISGDPSDVLNFQATAIDSVRFADALLTALDVPVEKP